MGLAADYVVVGGGTAGAIVARRLADSGATVTLLEAGPTGEHDPRVLALSRWMELVTSELDYDYAVEGQRSHELLRFSSARVLGGCSSHNTCIAWRAPDRDMQAWEAAGASGWGPGGTKRYFDRVDERVNVEDSERTNVLVSAFLEAARSWGLPLRDFDDPNIADGVGWFRLNKRGDLRMSSAVAYLFPTAEVPATLTISPETTACRLAMDTNNATTGVVTTDGTVKASEGVVLCAGAFGTPQLLLRSGVGPARDLARLGIDAVADVPGVGRHLLDHPSAMVAWTTSRPVPPGQSHWEAGALTRLDGRDHPEILHHLTTAPFEGYPDSSDYPSQDDAFALYPNVAHARSQGSVTLRSNDPNAPPIIDPGYYSDPDGYDEGVIVEGIRQARAIAAQEPLAGWIDREIAPGPAVTDARELAHYARKAAFTAFHPAGTCKMGAPDDPDSVVDPALRVRGLDRTWIADASIFPSMPTINPCLTVMMVGEKCSDLIVEDR